MAAAASTLEMSVKPFPAHTSRSGGCAMPTAGSSRQIETPKLGVCTRQQAVTGERGNGKANNLKSLNFEIFKQPQRIYQHLNLSSISPHQTLAG